MDKNGDTLVIWLARQLREQILTGKIKPREKMPTQASMTDQYGVSRTVVREAIAALRADGLVEVQHGVGAFVVESLMSTGGLKQIDRARISSVIDLLELRSAVEIEAATLAAERRSPEQEKALYLRFEEMEQQINGGGGSADLAFHMAVADATNNPRFREFLMLIGEQLIPRSALSMHANLDFADRYIKQIEEEHKAILNAISVRDSEGAAEAMRRHLKGSETRYRWLLDAVQ